MPAELLKEVFIQKSGNIWPSTAFGREDMNKFQFSNQKATVVQFNKRSDFGPMGMLIETFALVHKANNFSV